MLEHDKHLIDCTYHYMLYCIALIYLYHIYVCYYSPTDFNQRKRRIYLNFNPQKKNVTGWGGGRRGMMQQQWRMPEPIPPVLKFPTPFLSLDICH